MTHGAHLVGAAPNFDAEVLAALLRDNGLTPSFHYHLIDVEALAVGWLCAWDRADGEPGIRPPWRSDDLSRRSASRRPARTSGTPPSATQPGRSRSTTTSPAEEKL